MNIIFLDCDGVVTSTLETPGSYLNHDNSEYGPSPRCIERLLKLCDDTNSKIVISSNWRRFAMDGKWSFNGNIVTNPLSKLLDLLGDYCIRMLPPTRHQTKSHVLLDWLNTYRKDIDNFVIFDDDLNEGFQNITTYDIAANFIQTQYDVGLTDEDCKKAYNILKGINND